jgi:hypothetical protein
LHLTSRLDALGLRREEFLFLKAIAISNCDIRVEDDNSLKRLRDNLLTSLYDCVTVIRC